MRVLIVEDGLSSYILPAVRSMGSAGWTVGLGGPRRSRAASSRWVTRRHVVPPAEAGLDAFVEAVARAVAEGGYDVVFGGDDVEVLALSEARDRLGAIVPYAAHDVVLRSVDKWQLVQAAQRVGLAAPRTVAAGRRGLDGLTLPVVAKARLHWEPGAATRRGRHPARVCATSAELQDVLAEFATHRTAAVLQEVVVGDLMAVTALCEPGGAVLAECHQLATRTSPTLRTSTRARTVPIDQELSHLVGALLDELGWFGIANLQFLRPANGPPQLIDLNGRFYGSLVLALAAGLDLPVLWTELACSAAAKCDKGRLQGRAEITYQALEEDLRRARTERRGGLFLDCLGTLAAARGAVHSTWDPSDLRPALARCWELLASRRRRAGRRGPALLAGEPTGPR